MVVRVRVSMICGRFVHLCICVCIYMYVCLQMYIRVDYETHSYVSLETQVVALKKAKNVIIYECLSLLVCVIIEIHIHT